LLNFKGFSRAHSVVGIIISQRFEPSITALFNLIFSANHIYAKR